MKKYVAIIFLLLISVFSVNAYITTEFVNATENGFYITGQTDETVSVLCGIQIYSLPNYFDMTTSETLNTYCDVTDTYYTCYINLTNTIPLLEIGYETLSNFCSTQYGESPNLASSYINFTYQTSNSEDNNQLTGMITKLQNYDTNTPIQILISLIIIVIILGIFLLFESIGTEYYKYLVSTILVIIVIMTIIMFISLLQ